MREIKKTPGVIKSGDAVRIVCKTLGLVDGRLMHHGERVAYMLYHMLKTSTQYTEEEKLRIFCLGIFHDIGAYKTDEIDQMVTFESDNVWEHSIYGYLFLKYLSPLESYAEAILYHHLNYDRYDNFKTDYKEIALLIKLTDRIDICMQTEENGVDLEMLQADAGTRFAPEHVAMFLETNKHANLIEHLKDGSYVAEIEAILDKIDLIPEEINLYLQMLAYSIDFRSGYTVTHTVTTTAISVEIVKLLHYPLDETVRVYYGALLHDVGKIAIPLEILEYPGKLSSQAMAVMKTHVKVSEDILRGVVSDAICDIAVAHHEKLDGSGYHKGLREEDLNESQQIVAIADVLSALRQRRSYKNAFAKEQIIDVIKEERDADKLNQSICDLVITQYDEVMSLADENCKEFLEIYDNLQIEYDQIYNHVTQF